MDDTISSKIQKKSDRKTKSKAAIKRILATLDALYPFDGICFLNHQTPWQLLFATILSAQCTDDRVNLVTASLFNDYPDLESYVSAPITDLEKAVHSTGFYRAKARHLQESAKKLLTDFDGVLPSEIDQLTSLSGVGRKTANVVRSHIFKIPSIVVDTHVRRISNKLGLSHHADPEKIEYDLMQILPQSHWIRYNQQVITHGRRVCISSRPQCHECQLIKDCENPKS